MNVMLQIADFLLSTLFQLYIALILLRFLLQWARADFYNPLSQFIVKVTSPLLRPLRRIIPGWGGLDMACLLLAYLVTLVQVALVGAHIAPYNFLGLLDGQLTSPVSLLLVSLLDLFTLTIGIYMVAIFIQVIASWVSPGNYNPALALLHTLTEPLLRPARRMLPPIAGLDLSPMLVLLGLQVLKMLLVGLLLGS